MSEIPEVPIPIRTVAVRFRDTRTGGVALRAAARLARALGCPLDVSVPHPATRQSWTADDADRVTDAVRARIGNDLAFAGATRPKPCCTDAWSNDALVVDAELARTQRDVTALALTDTEFRMDDRTAPLVVPIGDGESGITGARVAAALAARLGAPLRFYHTTWRNPECVSEFPNDHVSGAADTVLRIARLAATAARVPHETVIETAPDVTDGMIRAAIRFHASCVVVARGGRTGKGSYVDQLLAESPIPVLVVSAPNPCPEVRP